MKKWTVLLDAGGVLLDETEHENLRATIIATLLSRVVENYNLHRYHEDIEEAVRCFCPHTYDYVFFKYLAEDLKLYYSLYAEYKTIFAQEKPPLLLSRSVDVELPYLAAEFNLGIAGQYGRELLELLEAHDLRRHLSWELTQDDFKLTKPDPRYYEQICQAMRVDPALCIMVGDRVDKDIVPAHQLGMRAVLVRTGIHIRQKPRTVHEIPEAEIDGIQGLCRVIGDLL